MVRDNSPSHYVRSRTIVALGLVMAVAVTLLSSALILWRHAEVIAKARDDLANVSTLLATQSNQAFQGINVVQDQLIDQLRGGGAATQETLASIAGDRPFHEELKRNTRSIDLLDAIGIVDERGKLLNFSRAWPVPAIDVSDREYFHVLMNASARSYWSRPTKSRGNGAWAIYRAQRFDRPDGAPLGLVLGTISVARLERHYASIKLPTRSSIALYRHDGVMLVRHPADDQDGQIASDSIARFARSLTSGAVHHVFDERGAGGEELITSVSRLPDYPLLVAASSPREAVLAGWRREAAAVGLLAAILNVTIGVAGLLGLRQLRAADRAFRAEQHAARHDVLTGLPNRSYFKQRLESMLCAEGREPSSFALLLIDLDHFKEVNDTFGHPAGDQLLRVVADRLRLALGPNDFLARLGGDEFAVIHPGDGGATEASALGANVLQALSSPVRLDEVEVRISCCVGLALSSADACQPDRLLAHADLALFRAKEGGRASVRAYTDEIGVERKERLSLLHDLREAVDGAKLRVFFQPIVNLGQRRIVAFEALLRWRDPARGFVSPATFIPLAEESGLIGRIGPWVLNAACKEAASWPEGVKVAVNLSPVQFRTQDVYAQTCDALAATGLAPARLMLEITESVQLEQTQAGQTLRDLRELGVGVSLDDFGTGYASLSYLRSFPFDLIKIDQSFVREMHRSLECEVIVQTVLAMGQRLGIDVTAEGVETMEQLERLRQQGCTKVQGYLLGVPMPAEAVPGFLANWRYPSSDGPKIALVS
jgi:diguanylate cyclase (GGDEF)-like protein